MCKIGVRCGLGGSFFFQAEDGIRDLVRSRGLGDVYKRQGADLKERNTMTDADLVAQRPLARAAYGGVLALPMPAVAAGAGFSFGGGLGFAPSCDLLAGRGWGSLGSPDASGGGFPRAGGSHLSVFYYLSGPT